MQIDIKITNEIERLTLKYKYEVTIGVITALLHVDRDTALDWLISKVSMFRGIPEQEIKDFIEEMLQQESA